MISKQIIENSRAILQTSAFFFPNKELIFALEKCWLYLSSATMDIIFRISFSGHILMHLAAAPLYKY